MISWPLHICVVTLLFSYVICTPKSQVDGMIPTYGPVAGKTIILLTGQNLSGLTSILLELAGTDDVTFSINEITETRVVCSSGNVSESLSVISGPLVLYFNKTGSGYNYTTDFNFTYKPNPVINRVTPGRGIVRGGIKQTITGEYLDSVYVPLMRMYLVHNNVVYEQKDHPGQKYAGPCTVLNSTQMLCNSKPVSNSPLDPIPAWNPLRRPEYKFWIGFSLDGVIYQNYSEFVVWKNPTFNPLDNELLPFRVYRGQKEIEIRGGNFNLGADQSDYNIVIGNGTTSTGDQSTCSITYFITNVIRCKPPQERPQHGGIHRDGEPAIAVKVGYLNVHLGYLDYQFTPWDNPVVRTAVITVVCGIVVLFIIGIVISVYRKRRRRRHDTEECSRNDYSRAPGLWTHLSSPMKSQLQPLLKEQDRLRLGRELGQGHFGSVYSAKFHAEDGSTVLVAAKTIRDTTVTPRELEEFLSEATMMRHFHHNNVLAVVGVVFKEGRPYVLIPFMANGDLREYLRNPQNKFTLANLLTFGLDVAKGMSYISKKNFVHRDLAARNCMVDVDETIKIADFGLTKDLHSADYYRIGDRSRPLPVKWMALESLSAGKFTVYSDVWSYGVVLWELLTRGKTPYADVDNFMLKPYLERGRRLDIPEITPDPVGELMTSCWNASPSSRPSFDQIVDILDTILEEDRLTEEQSPGYESLRRNRPPNDRHNYQNIIVQSEFDLAEQRPEPVIDSAVARAAFDDIPDPISDGYLKPRNGVAMFANGAKPQQQQQRQRQQQQRRESRSRSDYYNQQDAGPGRDNPGFVEDAAMGRAAEQPNSGYMKMDGGGRSKHHKDRPHKKSTETENIKLSSKK